MIPLDNLSSTPENFPPPGAVRLLDTKTIQKRILSLAVEIDSFFGGQEVLLIGILKGAVHFVSDLVRAFSRDPVLEWIRVRTYPTGTDPNSESEVFPVGDFSLQGRTILVLDDVLDRGQTVRALNRFFEKHQPSRVYWCFLLAKQGMAEKTGIRPDFVGFTVPNRWLIGYGLDLDERYRNLGEIYVLSTVESEQST